MSTLLTLTAWLVIAPASFAGDAADMRVVDEDARTPSARLALAESSAERIRSNRSDVVDWWARALFDGNDERLLCMQGHEQALTRLVAAAEEASRDLRPAVLQGQTERAERESRRIRIALDRADRIHAVSYECSKLVGQPIEPEPRRSLRAPEEADLVPEVDTTVFDLMSAVPW